MNRTAVLYPPLSAALFALRRLPPRFLWERSIPSCCRAPLLWGGHRSALRDWAKFRFVSLPSPFFLVMLMLIPAVPVTKDVH